MSEEIFLDSKKLLFKNNSITKDMQKTAKRTLLNAGENGSNNMKIIKEKELIYFIEFII